MLKIFINLYLHKYLEFNILYAPVTFFDINNFQLIYFNLLWSLQKKSPRIKSIVSLKMF